MRQTSSSASRRATKKAAAEAVAGAGTEPLGPKVRGRVMRVIGPSRGRWRAGRHFTSEAVTIPVAELDEEDLRRIESDPELKVDFSDQS
ncbi:MAG: hypothetical protein ACK4FR_02655 [Tabrizicola sp.]